jgi:GNAT superfamily N-acetyltransferase
MDPLDFNFVHALSLFAVTSKGSELFETQEFVLINSKAPVAAFNTAYLKRPDYKPARALERMQQHYARAGLPFRVHVRDPSLSVRDELSLRGFTPAPPVPCMLLASDARLAFEVPKLAIRRVEDAQALADLQRVAFTSFDYPLSAASAALTDALLGMSHVTFFVGYLDEQPVCCSGLVYTHEVAGIYWVGTLATQRKLGLGAAITAHAALEARRRGFARVCLQATELGAPVYRRIGFREITTYARFDHA